MIATQRYAAKKADGAELNAKEYVDRRISAIESAIEILKTQAQSSEAEAWENVDRLRSDVRQLDRVFNHSDALGKANRALRLIEAILDHLGLEENTEALPPVRLKKKEKK